MKTKYGRLTILKTLKINKRIYFECICICGNKKNIYSRSVVNGKSKSCGCLNSEIASKRMTEKNPMYIEDNKLKMISTFKRLGIRPTIRGGNGQEMPLPQRILLSALGGGWFAEHKVNTKLRHKGYPSCYKIDIANPRYLISIEVDGSSHNSLTRQKQDKKKEIFLKNNGWKTLRFKNKKILSNILDILKQINEVISTSSKINR